VPPPSPPLAPRSRRVLEAERERAPPLYAASRCRRRRLAARPPHRSSAVAFTTARLLATHASLPPDAAVAVASGEPMPT